jgi:NAD(P)-dependent dehydrogenase (short-subunit alcohol dehydrogenase family)
MIAMATGRQAGRLSVVTGGSGGMGIASARLLARQGAVVIADVRERELEAAAGELRKAGHEVTPVLCDVCDAQQVAKLAQTAARIGQVQALVHTAGLSPTMADWRRIMNVNLVGSALIEQAFAPLMANGGGAVFIASMAGHTAMKGAAASAVLDNPLAPDFMVEIDKVAGPIDPGSSYGLSKQGVIQLCQRVVQAWAKRGARINSISPGLIDTSMGKQEFAHQEMMAIMLQKTPVGRWGTAEEIAEVAVFLCSPAASFVTGIDILVDGGMTNVLMREARGLTS